VETIEPPPAGVGEETDSKEKSIVGEVSRKRAGRADAALKSYQSHPLR
jgi:hypothetical protein